jgi:hypothetical protein
MEITGLASIVGTLGVAPVKGGVSAQNNAALLASLPDNAVLRGVVQSRGANNTITLRTEQGQLTLQTDVFLKRGTEIALKVEQRAHESLMRIISVGGQSLTKYLEGTTGDTADAVARSSNLVAPALSAETGEVSAASQEIPTEEQTLNTLLRGVFLAKPEVNAARTAALASILQAQLEQASTGTSLQVKVISIQIPASDGKGYIPLAAHAAMLPPPVTSAIPQTGGYAMTPAQRMAVEPLLQTALQNKQAASASLPLASPPTSQTTQALPSLLSLTPAVATPAVATPPSSLLTQPNVVLASFAEPHMPSASPLIPFAATTTQSAAVAPTTPAASPASTHTASPSHPHALLPVAPALTSSHFTATVVQSAARELTVHSELGTLKLFVTTPLPRGTLITFDLQQITSVRGTGVESLEADFKAFEALAALQHPPASANMPNPIHILPRAGAAMGAELLFLLSALKGGDMRAWIGEDNLKRLESVKGGGGEKSDILSRLSSEFASLKTIPENVTDGQWRSVLIPILAEGQVQPIEYFYKKQQHEDAINGSRNSDHFMVELDLSHMGKMQLDGLVQKQGKRLQFDLIIRSERMWEESIRNDLRTIYQTAQSISRFTGMLTFRQGTEALMPHPVDDAHISESHAGSLMV